MSTTFTTTHRPGTTRNGRGFTLVEVLVVVGIMVLIAGIAIPMINNARKKGIKARVAADLQSIGVGLDAYRNDFGDFPRFTGDNDWPAAPTFLDGAEILCLAMIGPRSALGADGIAPGQSGDAPGGDGDGYDGPGFRTTIPPVGDLGARRAGRKYGPYLDASKFKVAEPGNDNPDLGSHEPTKLVIMSYYGTPIVYFPARAQKAPINIPNGYVAPLPPGTPIALDDPIKRSMWDARYGVQFFRHPGEAADTVSINRFRVMLGDTDANGSIGPGETAAHQGGYALWSAGHDDKFGPALPATLTPATVSGAVTKCDDVTNFR